MFINSGTAATTGHTSPEDTARLNNEDSAITIPQAARAPKRLRAVGTCMLALLGLSLSSPLHDIVADYGMPVFIAIAPPPLARLVEPAPTADTDITSAALGRFGLLSPDALGEYRNLQTALDQNDWTGFDARLAALSDTSLASAFAGLKLASAGYKPALAEISAWLSDNQRSAIAPAVRARAVALYGKAASTLPAATAVAPLSGDDREADGQGERSTILSKPASLMIKAVATLIEGDEAQAAEPAADTDADAGQQTAAAASPAWRMGLAAWKQGDMATVRAIFTHLAGDSSLHKWDRAGALFWAGRAAAAQGETKAMRDAWEAAAQMAPRSFYGLLAAQSLGQAPAFNWSGGTLTAPDLKELTSLTAGSRALMWLELGNRTMAEAELRQGLQGGLQGGIARASAPQRRAMLLLAEAEHLPNLAYGMAGQASGRNAALRMPALYPLPAWAPKGGFATDAAFVYALMRQESAFNPMAKSQHGAMGAMQIMPDTAAHVNPGLDSNAALTAELVTPELNIALGERYLQILARDGTVRGNLVKLVAAYNCGSGNLQRWTDDSSTADPLLYIEQLPVRETRSFVQSVLANYWMYQSELGQSPVSLQTLARGDWPHIAFRQPATTEMASAQ